MLSAVSTKPVCLIVGGGTVGSGMSALYADKKIAIISFDIYNSAFVDFVADVHSIPLTTASVDAVWIQAVLEHILSPEQAVAEILRVLKPGGFVYAETPFMQQVHEKAYDFTRFSHSGHRWLFRQFEEIDSGPVGGAGTQLLWSVEHFTRNLTRSTNLGKLAKLLFFWLRFLDPIMSRRYCYDTAPGFYFFGFKARTALLPSAMPQYYDDTRSRLFTPR